MFTLEIKTGNAAFDPEVSDPHAEIARILRNVADRVEERDDTGTTRDENGNTVCRFTTVLEQGR